MLGRSKHINRVKSFPQKVISQRRLKHFYIILKFYYIRGQFIKHFNWKINNTLTYCLIPFEVLMLFKIRSYHGGANNDPVF